MIKKVYEADPLVCQRCGGGMRIIAFIDQPDVIEKILTHLHLVRYYGWFSNVNRGKRNKAQEPAQQGSPEGTVQIPPPPGSSVFKQRWAQLI